MYVNEWKLLQQPLEEQFTHLPSKTTFFDPRMLPEHHAAPAYNQAIQTHYQPHHSAMTHAMVSKRHWNRQLWNLNWFQLSLQNWRRSFDDGDITPTNEIMEAKNDPSTGGTLPRHQRLAKRNVSTKIDLPPKQPLFNTDYTAEARKQMSMYYSTPSPSDPTVAIRRQSGPMDRELCQQIESCYIDGPSVHYGRTSLPPQSQFQSPYHHQMIYQQQMMHGGNFGNLYAGQMHQTQAEVHVEHSQAEVCMVSCAR